jgi:protoporphyrinogen oxidase
MRAFSRRELLQGFLGLPVALAACQRSPRLPEGGLAFTPETLGHRLRDQAPPTAPSDGQWRQTEVLIVGGGVAGLSAARRLQRAGLEDFVLLELESGMGGTARSGASSVASYPWGAHYITAPFQEFSAFVKLLDEVGCIEGYDVSRAPIYTETALCRDPEERLFHEGTWQEGLYLRTEETAEEARQRQRFEVELDRLCSLRDSKGRRAFTLPTHYASDDADFTALDKLSMADWMSQQGFTSARLLWRVDYACRDDYGARPQHTSAWAALSYFAARLRKAGAETQPVLTWPEGNGYLVKHLARTSQRQQQTQFAVADINPTESGVGVLAFAGDAVVGYRAKQVIFAANQFLRRYLIRPERQAPPAFLADFEYSPWMVANLHLRERPTLKKGDFALSWDNVLYQSPSLGYVVATHQICRDYGPTVLTYYYPLCDQAPKAARSRLLSLGWQEWADIALTDLEAAHPELRSLVERVEVARWGHAMVVPKPGLLFGGSLARAREVYRGVHFAHSDLSGIALFDEAFYHGIRAAEEVLAARQMESQSWL